MGLGVVKGCSQQSACDVVAVHDDTPDAAAQFAAASEIGFATDNFAALLSYGVDFVGQEATIRSDGEAEWGARNFELMRGGRRRWVCYKPGGRQRQLWQEVFDHRLEQVKPMDPGQLGPASLLEAEHELLLLYRWFKRTALHPGLVDPPRSKQHDVGKAHGRGVGEHAHQDLGPRRRQQERVAQWRWLLLQVDCQMERPVMDASNGRGARWPI